MDIVPKPATRKAEGEHFTGDVYIDVIARHETPESQVRVSTVRFAPGARNAWHAHIKGQTFYVLEGRGRVQSRGEEILEIRAGDVVYSAPGEWHWHGAAPEHFMSHLAMMDGAPPGQEDAEWGAPVTDEEYHGHAH